MATEVIRQTDDPARTLARDLLRSARSASLATLTQSGHPYASLTSMATDSDGTPLILISGLSGHTANLKGDARSSLLVSRSGKGDPLAHPRMTLLTRAEPIDRASPEGERVRRRFLAHQPKASLYADFPDFAFYALRIERASLNGGFARAYELEASDILVDCSQAQELIAAEAGAIDHMNADHSDAVRLYATALLGGKDGAWRITGIDPLGIDLSLGDATLRLSFDDPVTSPSALRGVLAALAAKARAAA